MVGRLSSDMAWNTRSRVSTDGILLPVFALTLLPDPMIARSSMQLQRTLSINILVVLITIKGNHKT